MGVWPHRGPCQLRFFSRLSETLIVLIPHHVLLPQFAVISMYYCISLLYNLASCIYVIVHLLLVC